MICPCCHNEKSKKDFYWRGEYLVYKECKSCKSEHNKEKQQAVVVKGYFNLKEFSKYYNY